ncbi:MAG: exodeoxyribonuclease VII large subunit [Proteobacteria bacterium]|nr:exodeoxyribonuclease VII large subunit [Pseudomonadota bacterium]
MIPEVLTVSQLNRLAREVLQQNFPLFWVSGEISNLTRATSGHVYFSLKDESAQVRCVMFRNRAQVVPWRLENGQQIEAQALVTLYEARGEFQLNIEGLRRAGIGALYEAYARLLERLEREGLFAAERKRGLPRFPRCVGIVSSPQAAALRDLVTTLRRRAPQLPVILYPAPVQGDGAAEKIAASILTAGERSECDVLIVARGGGSIEDLWAFNEECVARAIAACSLPVISGIGHETDTTIADFVADRRAATPTAAAELVSAGWFAATHELAALHLSLQQTMRVQLEARMQRVDLITHRLVHPGARLMSNRHALAHLKTRLAAATAHRLRREAINLERKQARLRQARPALSPAIATLALLGQRLGAATKRRLATNHARLATVAAVLAQLSPMATLQRGYSIVRDSHGKVVCASHQLSPGDAIELHFAQGQAHGHIDKTE